MWKKLNLKDSLIQCSTDSLSKCIYLPHFSMDYRCSKDTELNKRLYVEVLNLAF